MDNFWIFLAIASVPWVIVALSGASMVPGTRNPTRYGNVIGIREECLEDYRRLQAAGT